MQDWKMWDWNYRHQTAGVENAGPSSYGKPKHPQDWNCRSYLDFFSSYQAMVLTHSLLMPGMPAGFQAMVSKHLFDKIRLPTLVFSLPILPYVMVAHPASVDLVHLYQHRVWRDNLIAHHYTFIDKL